LDRLTKEMDAIVQKQFGKVMTDLCTSEQTPWQIKRVLEFVVNDGGAEIGMKKKMCNILVEWGSQIYYKLSVPGELFMLDELKYKKREDRVKEAKDILVEAIRQELDMDREIPVDCVTSWAPAVELCATKCIMEYILGCPVDLKDRDTIPYPNIPSAVTNEEAYSSDYSFGDIQFGLCRLDSMVEETPPNSILLLDSNGVLFNRKPGAMKDRMIHKHKYRTVTSVFGGAIDLLSHTDTRGVKKVSLRHGPPCHAVDSRPNPISIEELVQRALEMETLKQVVEVFQSRSHRILPPSKGDAIFGSYVFEYITTALKLHKIVSCRAFVHNITPGHVNALKQNGLVKTPVDYPISSNQRRRYRQEEPAACPQNRECIRRAKNFLSPVTNAHDAVEVQAAWEKAELVVREDEPALDTLAYRIKAVVNGIDSGSDLHKALCEIQANIPKENPGNPNARGFTTIERQSQEQQFETIISLGMETPFWVYHQNATGDTIPDESLHLGHSVFQNWTKEGLVGRLRGKSVDTRRNNTSVEKVSKLTEPLSIQSVLKNQTSQCMGTEGKQSFVICHLVPFFPDVPKAKAAQMDQAVQLPANVEFWTRFNGKTDPSQGPKHLFGCEIVYNQTTWIGIRDRLTKRPNTKACRKVMNGNRPVKSECGGWILMHLIDGE
jgi:hypothetical protein